MKILWFTWKDIHHPLAGGAELVNDELAKRLVADGNQVTMIVGGFAGAEQKQTINGYKVIRLGNRYSLFILAPIYYLKNLRGWADLVVEEVNTMPFFTKFYAFEPRILFFHQLCREIWFYQMPPVLSSIGYVVEPIYLRLLGGKTPTITVSQSAKNDLQKYGFKDVSIIPEAIKIEPVKNLDTKKYPDKTILSLGALRAMKRTMDHIKAFNFAKQKMPDLKLIVAGASEGNYGADVLNAINTSKYKRDITYINSPTNEQRNELYKKSHVCVMTSVKEGWGLVVTEAASQGTPSVVYDVDGLRDSVRDGETGLVTNVNPTSLAAGITELLSNKKLYNECQREGWQWSRELTFENCYTSFVTIINQKTAAKIEFAVQGENE